MHSNDRAHRSCCDALFVSVLERCDELDRQREALARLLETMGDGIPLELIETVHREAVEPMLADLDRAVACLEARWTRELGGVDQCSLLGALEATMESHGDRLAALPDSSSVETARQIKTSK